MLTVEGEDEDVSYVVNLVRAGFPSALLEVGDVDRVFGVDFCPVGGSPNE